ncbi:MAG: protein tyrosine phosphatase family protein [Colwellia sp.]|nr:protein tyrosine phosphatase family protein [Colwellia sp.]
MSGSIDNIKNFSLLSSTLASSGMPNPSEFQLVKQNGYLHVINLIPGDFSIENKEITALKMSFDQIAVDWSEPTLADFQQFVRLMKAYKQDKVLVHCRLNYRASAFAYLYQTTQLGVHEATAQSQMQAIWQPNDIWLEFINDVQAHYQTTSKK